MSSAATQKRRLESWRGSAVGSRHRRLVLLAGSLRGRRVRSVQRGRQQLSNSFSLKGTESQRAVDLLKRDFPAQSGDSDQIASMPAAAA